MPMKLIYQAEMSLVKYRFALLFHKNCENDITNGLAEHIAQKNYSVHEVSF